MRFVTAASLFDGHDAAINIMRRILQSMGAEVIHLGHNRSVDDVVTAACRKTPGHRHQLLPGRACGVFQVHGGPAAQRGGSHIQVFGGGGGVIVPAEIREAAYGVSRIYSPKTASAWAWRHDRRDGDALRPGHHRLRLPPAWKPSRATAEAVARALAQLITALENQGENPRQLDNKTPACAGSESTGSYQKVPVLGITGTGGAGKSA